MLALMQLPSPQPRTRAGRAVLAVLEEDPGASIEEIRAASALRLGRPVDHKTVTKYRRLWQQRAPRSTPPGVPAC